MSKAVARAVRESDRRTNQQVLGAVLLAIGGNWLLAEFDLFTFGWPGLFAVALMTLGMAMVGTAKAGRTKPLIALGIVLTLGLAMSSGVGGALGGGFGDVHHTPQSASQLEAVYQREIGDLILDLRNVDPGPGIQRTSASVGFGDVDLVVPDDIAIRVIAVVDRFGDINLPGSLHANGINERATYQSKDFETADEKLEVSLYTSVGDITVELRP